MTTLSLTKHHGLGNDFLINLQPAPERAADLARSLCNRSTGIGADGLIFGEQLFDGPVETAGENGAPETNAAQRWRFTLFNSDGSAAELSGNGLRCFGQAVAMATGVDVVRVIAETPAGDRRIDVDLSAGGRVGRASVDMGAVTDGIDLPADLVDQLNARGVALDDRAIVSVSTADIGNPHVVFEVVDPAAIDLPALGRAVEAIVGGTNVHLIRPDGADRIEMRVWERGSGITQACGSGASVVAAVANRHGMVGRTVTVAMPGGCATVEVADGQVTLIGPAVYVGRVEVPGD